MNAEATGPQCKKFIELARGCADKTHEKTDPVPFMSYWPCYSHMNEAQRNRYFYLRGNWRECGYPETDLSYIFVYVYELINQINVADPSEGFTKLTGIWLNYRERHTSLDRYLTEWAVDYIEWYGCDERASYGLLDREGLLYLIPAGILFDYHIKNDMILPVPLIARFSHYHFLESKFVKGENGSLYLEALPHLIHHIRDRLAQSAKGVFRGLKRVPFQRALFDNPGHIRLKGYPSYERHKPLRDFITSAAKELENQLRICFGYSGRLTYPARLPDDIMALCKTYAQSAADGRQYGQTAAVRIDRGKVLSLTKDSDAVRDRLLEGNAEYAVEINRGLSKAPPPAPGEAAAGYALPPGLSAAQNDIIGFLLRYGSGTEAEITAAFPGIFAGLEIDRINDAALETINDLLIVFEDGLWHLAEDYKGEMKHG
jgi:hypothetical protein